jgi:hypothetical protein
VKTFDKELPQTPITHTAIDVCKKTIDVGDIVIGAIGSKEGYIFKGTVLGIYPNNMIKVKQIWGDNWREEWKVDAKRVRNMKYEKV